MTDSLGYLLGRAAVVEQRVRELVAERRAADPAPDDPFRGLYLTDDAVDRAAALWPGGSGWQSIKINSPNWTPRRNRPNESGADIRLRRLARRCRPDAAGRRAADDRSAARSGFAVRAAVRLPQRRRDPASRLGRVWRCSWPARPG